MIFFHNVTPELNIIVSSNNNLCLCRVLFLLLLLTACPYYFFQVSSLSIILFIANRDNNTPPHALQWAFRNPITSNTSSNASATTSNVTGSGLVYMDTAQLRRSGGAASADGAAANSMYSTPSALARTFAILIREVFLNLKNF